MVKPNAIKLLIVLLGMALCVLADKPEDTPGKGNGKAAAKKAADDLLDSSDNGVKLGQKFNELVANCSAQGLLKKDWGERLQFFKAQLAKISAANAGDLPYTTEINCFAILDADEVSALLGLGSGPTNEFPSTTDPFAQPPARRLLAEDPFGMGPRRQLKGKGKPGPPPAPPASPIVTSPRLPPPSPKPRPTCPLTGGCDWRNVNGRNFVPDVRNQGGCGCCWAFAGRGAWESQMMIAGQTSTVPASSSQYIVNCAPNLANGATYTSGGTGRCQYGGWMDEAWTLFANKGYVSEATLPYSGSNQMCTVLPALWPTSMYAGNYVPINSYSGVNSQTNVATLKQALVTGPVAVAVRAEFGGFGTGVFFCGSSAEGAVNHAMLVVGWTNIPDANGVQQEAWIVQNSWGSGWGGLGGYIYITTNPSFDCGVSQWYAGRPVLRDGPFL